MATASDCTAAPWRPEISAARCACTVPVPVTGRRLHLIYHSNLRKPLMHKHSTPVNRRILIIDDNRDIHRDFRKVIGGGLDDASSMAAAELALLGETAPSSAKNSFEIDSAYQGQEGVARVRQALDDG